MTDQQAPPPGAQSGGLAPFEDRIERFRAFMAARSDRLRALSPNNSDASRFAEQVIMLCEETPKLLECDPRSVWQGVLEARRFGLEPGGRRGHCYLIPRNITGRGLVANFQMGYKGYAEMFYRHEEAGHLDADVVKDPTEIKDEVFDYQRGTSAFLKHHKGLQGDRSAAKTIAAWASVTLRNGSVKFEVMSLSEIEHVRTRSKARSGPWFTDFDEMAKKTVLLRVLKTSPLSSEMARASSLDELGEVGRQDLIGEYEKQTPTAERRAGKPPVSEAEKATAEDAEPESSTDPFAASGDTSGYPDAEPDPRP